MLSPDSLKKSIEEAAAAVRTRESELRAATVALGQSKRELQLLAELAELKGVELPPGAKDVGEQLPPVVDLAERQPRLPRSSARSALLDIVIEILREAGKPMQIQALMAAVKGREAPLPGQGSQANLIAVISRDSRIVRPERGHYGLAEWGLEDAPLKKRSERRRRSGNSR